MKNGVSVIIPVYNEEKIIEGNTIKLAKFMKDLKIPFEIIFSDNGSTDRTIEYVRKLQKKYPVKALSIPQKGWVGLAFKKAVLASKYENLISMDMDLSADLNFIPECVSLLNEHSIVVGSKQGGKQARKLHRLIISSGYIFLARLLLGLDYSDFSMSAKGFKKSAIAGSLKDLNKESFYVTHLLALAKKRNKKVIEIPVHSHDKRGTQFNMTYEIFQRFKNLVSYGIRFRLEN